MEILPQEIQDKIFLMNSFEDLENSREFQSEYVKNTTQFDNYDEAIEANNLNCMKWLHSKGNKLEQRYFDRVIDLGGNLEILEWLYSVDCVHNPHHKYSLYKITELNILKLVNEKGMDFDHKYVLRRAMDRSDFETMNWITGTLGWLPDPGDLSFATYECNLQVLNWLFTFPVEYNHIHCYNGAFSRSDSKEMYEIIEFLKSKNIFIDKTVEYEQVLSDAIYNEAPIEHLKLALELGAGLYTYTFDAAVYRNRKDVMEWLLSVNCPVKDDIMKCFTSYTAKDNFELIKWLHTKGYKLIEGLYESAFRWSNYEMYLWLLEKNCPKPDDLLFLASRYASSEIFKDIYLSNKRFQSEKFKNENKNLIKKLLEQHYPDDREYENIRFLINQGFTVDEYAVKDILSRGNIKMIKYILGVRSCNCVCDCKEDD